MIHVTDQLYNRLTEGLQRIALESENPLQRAERSCRLVEAILEELKAFIKAHAFPDTQAEITFFKEIKPRFLKELFYFVELFYLEAFRPVGSRKKRREYLQRALDRVAVCFDRYQLLYTYYRMDQSHLDHLFFLREAGNTPLWPDSTQELDPGFSTLHSHQLARLQACEALRDYLHGQLQQLDEGPALPQASGKRPARLTWTASKASLIELAYALRSRGAVNFGQGEVKEVISGLEQLFGIQLGNFYRVYQGMRIRKKSRTPFLDHLKESLEQRMDEADEA